MITSLRVSKERSCRWKCWKTLSQDHIKQCLLWLKEKRRYNNGTSRSCRRCCLVTVEGGCQEEAQKEKGNEAREVNEIAPEEVEGSKEKVSVHDGIKEAVQRKAEQSFMRSWDWSQKAKMKKRKKAGEKGTRKRIEQLEVMQKVLELVVHERMSQGKGVKGRKEKKKKKVPGWSIEEMKEKQILLWWKTLKK